MRRAVLIAVLALAAPAQAVVYPIPVPKHLTRYQVGIGEQDPVMFSDATFAPLGLKRVRYIVPWDWNRASYKRDTVTRFMLAAQAAKAEVLVHFASSAGCYDGKRYLRKKHCRAPTVRAYTRSVRAFRKAFPYVHVFGAWNEANHKSQPIYHRPKLAARYYNALRRTCRSCTIVAADLLDEPSLPAYVHAFRKVAKHPRLWGLHNYIDVNYRRPTGTRGMLRLVPGRVWLTETGGLVRFGAKFPYSLKRAAAATEYLFDLADRFSHRRRGLRSRITRIYPYAWRGEIRGAHYDSGLVGPTGKQRPAYRVFRHKLFTRSR
ncbi:MAG: hypothetical protein QOI80_321 [Solirubrobacteraceae bacterium]|jgi:hypothetical protein|nr:hypothetical protein [Solirubrobacteraceae bacterium]